MSIALAYDTGLSRVRITGDMPGILDTFSRTAADTWSTSDSGHSWLTVGTAADYDVAAGFGTHTHGAANVVHASTIAINQADGDWTTAVQINKLPTGGDQVVELVARYADASNHYAARLAFTTGAQILVQLRKVLAGAPTGLVTIDSGLDPVTNVDVMLRFRVDGSALKAKVWFAASPEPDAWTVEASDAAIATAGAVGVRTLLNAGTSNTPVVFSFNSFTSGGDAVIERSADGITWSPVRGGTLDGTADAPYQVDDYEFEPNVTNHYRLRVLDFEESDDIEPTLDTVWIKNLRLPYLNRAVTISDWGDEEYPARESIVPIIGRTYPIAVNDLRLAGRFDLMLTAANVDDARDVVTRLMGGDVILLHVPPGCPVKGGYYSVGDVRMSQRTRTSRRRYIALPLTAVAAPGPDVTGATTTWAAVVATYATWAELVAANLTWQDVLDGVADPEDVIVP